MKRGFTLIELLVVIAIIGILSGIILTFLNSARLASKDARIVSDLRQFKNIEEINRDLNGNYKGKADMFDPAHFGQNGLGSKLKQDVCVQQGLTVCSPFLNPKIGNKLSGIIVSPDTNDPSPSYCAYAYLPANKGAFYACADSSGVFKTKAAEASPCSNTAPYKCN